jgi:hypothetical protein
LQHGAIQAIGKKIHAAPWQGQASDLFSGHLHTLGDAFANVFTQSAGELGIAHQNIGFVIDE